jgi:hypothetical protein
LTRMKSVKLTPFILFCSAPYTGKLPRQQWFQVLSFLQALVQVLLPADVSGAVAGGGADQPSAAAVMTGVAGTAAGGAAAGAAAAAGGAAAGAGAAAAAAAAAAAGARGAFALLRQPAAGGRGNGNRRATEVGGGRGKGGAGGKKVCVPCTMVKLQLTSPKAARAHAEAVIVDGQHQRPANRQHPERGGCVHCKCEDCQKVFRREGASPAEFKKTWECVNNKQYQP